MKVWVSKPTVISNTPSMRIVYFCIILQLFIPLTKGNDTSKRIYVFKVLSYEYIFGPTALQAQYDVNYFDDPSSDYDQMVFTPNGQYEKVSLAGIGLSVSYQIRFSMIEFNKNSSLSLSTFPTLGLTLAYGRNNEDFGFGQVTLPAFLEYNFGTMSGLSFTKNNGITVGLGMEYMVFPLYLDYNSAYQSSYDETEDYSYKRRWAQPAIYIAYKFVNRHGEYRAIMLKAGASAREEFVNDEGIKDSYRNVSLSIGLIQNLSRNQVNKSNRKINKHRNEEIQF